MNLPERARRIADAVLYEGYVLYPYRASSGKNRRRWMFGTLYPQRYSEATGEPFRLRCECLLEAADGAEIEARARFLRGAPESDGALPVEVDVGPLRAGDGPHRRRFAEGALEGEVEVALSPVGPGIHKLVVSVTNLSPCDAGDPEAARLRSLQSAQVVLGVRDGGFVSLIDPPEALRTLAEGCRNAGAWPVLVGAPGDRSLVLCAPIILSDHPAVAPESPCDFFDGTEMDEMLALRILTLSEAEQREAAAGDERVLALLARVQGLGPDEMARLHGAIRSGDNGSLERRPRRTVRVGDREVGPGDRVRLHPSGRADIFDLALDGQEATVASIEEDYEDRAFVTVTVDADPGRDLGARGLPGHRFFFRPDEIEPLEGEHA